MGLAGILTISFLVISILGTFLHFTHSIFKKGILLHVFSAVNESTWEHMKLLLAPTLTVILLQYIYLSESHTNIMNAGLALLLIETLSIPLLYEPLRLLIKRMPLIITIFIFYTAVGLGVFTEYIFLKNGYTILEESTALIVIFLIVIVFGIFTYYPPKLFLFKDPVTGKYGDTKSH